MNFYKLKENPIKHIWSSRNWIIGVGTSDYIPLKQTDVIFHCAYCLLPILFVRFVKWVWRVKS